MKFKSFLDTLRGPGSYAVETTFKLKTNPESQQCFNSTVNRFGPKLVDGGIGPANYDVPTHVDNRAKTAAFKSRRTEI
jgi:hypothetical protein